MFVLEDDDLGAAAAGSAEDQIGSEEQSCGAFSRAEIEELLVQRETARAASDWASADAIRAGLRAGGGAPG